MTLYLGVMLSFLSMQVLVEWKNFKIRSGDEAISSVMKKTGIVTLFVSVVAGSNIVLDMMYPVNVRSQSFYLCKDYLSCFVIFVLMPVSLIIQNSFPDDPPNCLKLFREAKQTFMDTFLRGKFFNNSVQHGA